MILLVPNYIHPDKARKLEIGRAMLMNLTSAQVEEMHVFVEDDEDVHREKLSAKDEGTSCLREALGHRKVHVLHLGKRVTHVTFISYANSKFKGRRVCYANADVHFDDTLGLLENRDLSGTFVCLAKWDGERIHSPAGSQDAWIFDSPIPFLLAPWKFGVAGTDNKIAHAAHEAGLKTVNPSQSVILHHLHHTKGGPVTYDDQYPPPYREVPVSDISSLPVKMVKA